MRSSRSWPSAKAQVIRFAVIGDIHVGYGNSSSIYKNLLPTAGSGVKPGFVIFGGDNARAGADHGTHADSIEAFRVKVV
ncbi:hypothetical protein D3C73_1574390 [compost metagenome]